MESSGVRLAVDAEAPELARIQRDTWRYAYAALLPQPALAALDGRELVDAVRDAVAAPETTVHVATEGTWIVGWCVAGPAPDGEATSGLLGTLLVEPRWGRRGHGGRLLGAARRVLAEQGLVRATTWVPERDAASLAFFTKAGWEPDGTVRTLRAPGEAGSVVRELRFAVAL